MLRRYIDKTKVTSLQKIDKRKWLIRHTRNKKYLHNIIISRYSKELYHLSNRTKRWVKLSTEVVFIHLKRARNSYVSVTRTKQLR